MKKKTIKEATIMVGMVGHLLNQLSDSVLFTINDIE